MLDQVRAGVGEMRRSIGSHQSASLTMAKGMEELRAFGTEVRSATAEQLQAVGRLAQAVEEVRARSEAVRAAGKAQEQAADRIRRELSEVGGAVEGGVALAGEMRDLVGSLVERGEALRRSTGRFRPSGAEPGGAEGAQPSAGRTT